MFKYKNILYLKLKIEIFVDLSWNIYILFWFYCLILFIFCKLLNNIVIVISFLRLNIGYIIFVEFVILLDI